MANELVAVEGSTGSTHGTGDLKTPNISQDTFAESIKVALDQCLFECPVDGDQIVTATTITVFVNGTAVVRHADTAACGAILSVTQQTTVFAGD